MIRAVEQIKSIPLNLFLIIKRGSFSVLIICGLCLAVYKLGWLFPAGEGVSNFLAENYAVLEGLAYIFFFFWGCSLLMLGFANQKLMRCGKKLGKTFDPQDNLLEYLDFKAAKIIKNSLSKDHLPFERLLFYLILSSNDISFSLNRLSVDRADLKQKLLAGMKERSKSFSPDNAGLVKEMNAAARQEVLELACRHALANNSEEVTIFDLFLVLAARDRNFQAMMDSLELLKEDVESVFLWQRNLEVYRQFRKRFWEKDNLRLLFATSPVRGLLGGYTATLDRFSRDISTFNPLRQGGVVLHQTQIAQVEEALMKQKGNGVLLVGEAGSGRRSIVHNLANRMASESGPVSLRMMRILELDMVALVAACVDEGELIAGLETIFQEAIRAKNVILILPGLDSYVGKRTNDRKLAAIDMSGIIARYLGIPGFRVIGIADGVGFRRSIESAGEIAARFAKIEVAPATTDETMRVLKEECLRRENKTGLFFPISSLREIVKLCDQFIAATVFPGKALELLDDVISNRLGSSGKVRKAVAVGDIDAFFTRKYDIPAGLAGQPEKEALLNLEDRIHEGLINQKEAVAEVANALRRARAQIKDRKRTIGNFLFLGPTGCGKTETAKQLAKVYFGSAKNMIRLDMSEYQTIESIDKLIGSQEIPGYLSSAIRKNPFSLVLVDEIEKAHPGLLNIFLSIFDEGEMTDGFGRKIDFRNSIIIATSNAGAEQIKEAVERGESMADFRDELVNKLLAQGVFKPEFINRFDAAVLYRPLDQNESAQVAMLMLGEVQSGLRQRRIEFEITDQLAQGLAAIGFDPVFGGRAMRRALQDKIENPIAKALLSGGLKPGDKFTVDPNLWELAIEGREP